MIKAITGIVKSIFGFATGLGLLAIVLGLVFVGTGFARYTYTVAIESDRSSPDEGEQPMPIDGVVVLTGGADRVKTGMRLLNETTAGRLLISGVHPETSKAAIGRTLTANKDTLECCVDIGHKAQNTIGNAAETYAWATANGYKHLLLVTSDYHMPRALVEMSYVFDNQIRITPHTVTSPHLLSSGWYKDPEALKLLASEYSKYLASRLRGVYRTTMTQIVGGQSNTVKNSAAVSTSASD